MRFILALDQGTTSSRAIVFDDAGHIVATAQREFAQHFPKPGWVEHDPADLWQTQRDVALEAVEQAGLSAKDISGVGITNQRETTLVWDRATGKPIHHAIVWQDRRTAPMCERLIADGHAELFRQRTGLLIDAYFSATKIAWLLDHVDGARDRAARGELAFGTVDTWLLWNLTGGAVHATDPSNASRTLLYNIHTHTWDDELLRLLDVPRELLPGVLDSSGVFGNTGLLGGETPIAGVAGDQQAALFGQLCTTAGMVKTTYGTGCFLLMNTGEQAVPSQHKLLTTAAWRIGGQASYALEGSVFVGGAATQWLRDGLGIIQRSSDIEALARQVDDADGVVFVPALTGLGAPHWDASARGTIVGLSRGTTAAHLARAALEGIAHQVADVIDAMRSDAHQVKEMRADGGAARNDLLMQMQADLIQSPVVRPQVTETTALGAAYLAGLATGVWPDAAALADQWRADRTFEPAIGAEAARAQRDRWRRAIDRAKGWDAS